MLHELLMRAVMLLIKDPLVLGMLLRREEQRVQLSDYTHLKLVTCAWALLVQPFSSLLLLLQLFHLLLVV